MNYKRNKMNYNKHVYNLILSKNLNQHKMNYKKLKMNYNKHVYNLMLSKNLNHKMIKLKNKIKGNYTHRGPPPPQGQCLRRSNNLSFSKFCQGKHLYVLFCWSTPQIHMNSKVTLKLSTKSRQLGGAIKIYCVLKFFFRGSNCSPLQYWRTAHDYTEYNFILQIYSFSLDYVLK